MLFYWRELKIKNFVNSLKRLLQSFKVSRIRDACFTASLFQGFITHNSSPKLGEVPEGRRGLSPPKQTKTVSVCFQIGVPHNKPRHRLFVMGRRRSGDISRPNDDEVIGQCNLVTEHAILPTNYLQNLHD